MKRLFALILSLAAVCASATTLSPITLLNPAGSTSGQAIISSGPSSAPAWGNVAISTLTGVLPVANGGTNASAASGTALDNITGFASTGFLTRTGAGTYAFQSTTNGITLGNLAQAAANTVLANGTGSTANVTAFSMPSCSTSVSALNWTSGTGFTCNTGLITAATVSSTYAPLASPALTGTPTAPTAGAGTNTTQLATTAFVTSAVGAVSGKPYFQAYRSTSQSFTASTSTKAQFDTKVFDSGSYYDNTTNYRFTPLVAGKYWVHVVVELTSTVSTTNQFGATIRKNGAVANTTTYTHLAAGNANMTMDVMAIVTLNGSTDYIEGWVYADGTSPTVASGANNSYIEASYIGP